MSASRILSSMKPLPQLLRTNSLLIPRRHLKFQLFNPKRNWKQKIIYQFWRPLRNEDGKVNMFNVHYNLYLYVMALILITKVFIEPKWMEDPDYKPYFNIEQNPFEKLEEYRKAQAEKNNTVFKESKLANSMIAQMAESKKAYEEEQMKVNDEKKEAEAEK